MATEYVDKYYVPSAQTNLTGFGRNAINVPLTPQPITQLPEAHVIGSTVQEERPSAFMGALYRSVDETQGALAGAAGLIGDIIAQNAGSDTMVQFGDWLRTKGFEEYQEQMRQAAENPALVGSVFDINDTDTFLTWVAEKAGELAPSAATMLLSSGIATAGTSLASKYLLKKAASKMALSLAAQSGTVAASSAIEAGSNWTQDVESHGMEGTSPVQDLAFGVGSGLTEVFGAENRLLRTVFGKAFPNSVEKEVAKEFKKGLVKNLSRGVLQSSGEGAQEAIQEMLSVMNANIQDQKYHLTEDNVKQLVDAFAAGAVGGAIFNGVGAGIKSFQAAPVMEDERNKVTESAPMTEEEAERQARIADVASNKLLEEHATELRKRYEDSVFPLQAKKAELAQLAMQARTQGDEQTASAYDAEIMKVAAEITKVNARKDEDLKSLERRARQLKDVAAKNQMTVAEDLIKREVKGIKPVLPEELARLTPEQQQVVEAHAKDIEDFTKAQHVKSTVRLAEINRQIAELRKTVDDAEFAAAMTDDFFGGRAEAQNKYFDYRAEAVSQLDKLTKQRDAEVKWSNTLFKKAEGASRALVHTGKGEDYRVTMALTDLYAHSNDRTPYQQRVQLDSEGLVAVENVDNKFLNRFGETTEQLAKEQKNLIKSQQQKSRNDIAREQRMEALRQRADTSEIVSGLESDIEYERRLREDFAYPMDSFLDQSTVLQEPFQSTPDSFLQTLPQVTPSLPRSAKVTSVGPLKAPKGAARFDKAPSHILKKAKPIGKQPRAVEVKPTPKPVKRVPAIRLHEGVNVLSHQYAEGARDEAALAHAEKVAQWASAIVRKLPALAGKVHVLPDSLAAIPAGVVDQGVLRSLSRNRRGVHAVYTRADGGNIWLFANHVTDKNMLVRFMLHEGVAHHGIKALFKDEKSLNTFLTEVYNSLYKTPEFQEVQERYRNVLLKTLVAEEYIASLAERVRVGQILSKPEKTVWDKFKQLIRTVFAKLGIYKVTKDDVNAVIEASLFNLTNPDAKIFSDADVSNVRASMNYQVWKKDALSKPSKIKELKNDYLAARVGTDSTGEKVAPHRGVERFVENIADSFRRMLTVQRYLKSKGGKITADSNVYRKQEVASNRSAAAVTKFRDKFISGKGGLIELVAAAREKNESAKAAFEKVSRLAYAVHALERNNHVNSGMTNAEAQAIRKQLMNPARMAVVEKIKEINNYRLDLLEQNNLYPKEVIKKWRDTYQYYVPLKGWEEEQSEINPAYVKKTSGSRLHTGAWKPSEFAKGRTSEAANPVLHTLQQVEDTIAMAEQVRVGRAFLKLAEDNPQENTLWQLEKDTPKGYKMVKAVGEDGSTYWKPERRATPFEGKAENLFTTIDESGNKVSVLINDAALLHTLRGTNVFQTGDLAHTVISRIGRVTRWMAVANTYLNPEFILSNMFRDLQAAAINFTSVKADLGNYKIPVGLNRKIVKDFNDSQKAIRNALLKGKTDSVWGEWFKKYQEYGGYTDYLGISDFKSMRGDLEKEIARLGDQGFTSKAFEKLELTAKYLENQASVFENMTRLSTFKNIAETLVEQGMAPEQAYDRAANIALNLTVNFTKKGALAPIINPLFMFANAGIQANARLLKTVFTKEPGVPFLKQRSTRFLAGLLMMPVAMGMMGRALGGEDDDGVPFYDKIPDYVKNTNMIIMLPGTNGNYVKIPMAYGFHLFTTIGNMAFSMSNQVGAPTATQAAWNVMKATYGNFSPIGSEEEGWTTFVPTAFRPFAQIATNQNYFGQPIRPEQQFFHKGEYPASNAYWSNCNEAAVTLAKFLNRATGGSETREGFISISPENIEHVVDSYSGGSGKFMSKLVGSSYSVLNGVELKPSDMPFARRFVGESGYYETLPLYNKIKTSIETDLNDYQFAKDSGIKGADLADVRKQVKDGLALEGRLRSIENRLKTLRKKGRESRLELDGADLMRQQEKLRERQTEIMKQLIKVAKGKDL